MENYYGFIYMTTNKINNKKYIGQKKFDKEGKWKKYLGSGVAFRNAVLEYGEENFTREILAYAYSFEELNSLEIEYIKKFNAVNDRMFYNLVDGGGTVTGLKFSKDSKLKLSKRFSGRGNYFYGKRYIGKENPFYGKNHSEESRKKMSISHKGKEPWNKGKTNVFSEESLKRMSEAKKGKHLSEEHKFNISKSQSGENHPMYGKRHSIETKRKISESKKGKPSSRKGIKLSEETKRKLSESKQGQNSKKVICITTNKVFDSIKEASEFYNCNKSDITQCCKGKRKTSGKLSDGTKLKWGYYKYVNTEVSK